MKFSVGEKVLVKGKKYTGEVIQAQHVITVAPSGKSEVKKYLIRKLGTSYIQYWHNEDVLEKVTSFTPEMEKAIKDVLIDANLKTRNFNMVKAILEDEEW